MKNKILLILIIISSSCKSLRLDNSKLSKQVKVLYSTKTIDSCHYIITKVINNNDVGVYIPLIQDKFLSAKHKDIYISGLDVDESDYFCNEPYYYENDDGINLISFPMADDIKHLYKKVRKIVPYKEFWSQEGLIEETLSDFKYGLTYFIDANSSIEFHYPINDILHNYKSIKSINIFEGNNKFRKKAMADIKIDITHNKDTIWLDIPKYSKKIKDYYLVTELKIKDTIIKLK